MTTRDLVALWEEHCRCEFETRDANATMATMVPHPSTFMPTTTAVALPASKGGMPFAGRA
jgi:carboxymethylenebutenolidase